MKLGNKICMPFCCDGCIYFNILTFYIELLMAQVSINAIIYARMRYSLKMKTGWVSVMDGNK